MVTDHSDGMGFFPQLISGDPTLLATPQGRRWYDAINSGKGAQAAVDIITSFGKGQMPKGFPTPGTPAYRSAWRETIKAADEANAPGRFTAFIGYEWTSNAGGNNLHRNVIWRDNGAKASLVEPFTTLPPLGSSNPRDLWKWMANTEEKTGAEILALAHNGNLSNGRMFRVFGPSHARSYQEVTVSRDPTGFRRGPGLLRGAEGRDGPGIPSEATKAPSAPDLKLALRECSSASAPEGALGGSVAGHLWAHPKRRSKALQFSSLGSLTTNSSRVPDRAKLVGIFALSPRTRGKASVFAQASQKRRGVGRS